MPNAVNNDTARAILFQAAYRSSQEVSPQPAVAGGVNTIDLPHAGIGLGVRISIQGSLERVSGTGAINFKPQAPYSIIKNVLFKDYTGITRINADGYSLHLREILQKQNYDSGAISDYTQPYSNILFNMAAPGDTAGNKAPFNFTLYLPIALNDQTTVGSYPFTVPTGNSTIYLTLGDMTDLVAAADAAKVKLSSDTKVYACYYYLDPPADIQLPIQDFSLVHELATVKQTDNLSANSQKRFTLDTGRTYYQLISTIMNNGAPDTANVSKIAFLLNGSTPVMNEYLVSYLARVRKEYGRDLPVGVFVHNFFDKPWTPDAYGSLQLAFDLGAGFTGGGDTSITVLKETLYLAVLG
jgi:hypothetical protein